MKKLMKKVNLGILIAAVLTVATAAYVIITDISFSSKESELKAFITRYIDDCSKANIGSSKQVLDNQKDVIAEYFSDYEGTYEGRDSYDTMNTKELSEILQSLCTDDGDRELGSVTDCKASIGNVECEKYGMNCAKLTVDVTMTITAKGAQAVVCECGVPGYVECRAKNGEEPVYETTVPAKYIFILSPSGSSWLIDSVRAIEDSPRSTVRVISGGISPDSPEAYYGGEGDDYE